MPEIEQKVRIVMASLEAEAEFCQNIAQQLMDDGFYEASDRLLLKEEAYRACASMLKEELGWQ